MDGWGNLDDVSWLRKQQQQQQPELDPASCLEPHNCKAGTQTSGLVKSHTPIWYGLVSVKLHDIKGLYTGN